MRPNKEGLHAQDLRIKPMTQRRVELAGGPYPSPLFGRMSLPWGVRRSSSRPSATRRPAVPGGAHDRSPHRRGRRWREPTAQQNLAQARGVQSDLRRSALASSDSLSTRLKTVRFTASSRTSVILASISASAESNQASTALSSSQSPSIIEDSTATASACLRSESAALRRETRASCRRRRRTRQAKYSRAFGQSTTSRITPLASIRPGRSCRSANS
mmetsp:Transcript_34370/g.42438  ORF Transcript_34370/g.42438 Transcript_34370/m.42438 type:complete len:216 (-) Transcript_34370:4611-5258(-)